MPLAPGRAGRVPPPQRPRGRAGGAHPSCSADSPARLGLLCPAEEIPRNLGDEDLRAVRCERQRAAALLALARCVVEVRREVAALRPPLLAEEHEPVGLEEMAEILVRE